MTEYDIREILSSTGHIGCRKVDMRRVVVQPNGSRKDEAVRKALERVGAPRGTRGVENRVDTSKVNNSRNRQRGTLVHWKR